MSRKAQILAMLADEPDNSFLRYGLAMEYVSAGQTELALATFRELLQRDPDYVPAYLQAGQLLARMGRESEARDLLVQGIQVAQRVGNSHAASEMSSLLATLA
ncbi:MAG: tetratricopeptide repeat protein [Gemmataceae bacterium]